MNEVFLNNLIKRLKILPKDRIHYFYYLLVKSLDIDILEAAIKKFKNSRIPQEFLK